MQALKDDNLNCNEKELDEFFKGNNKINFCEFKRLVLYKHIDHSNSTNNHFHNGTNNNLGIINHITYNNKKLPTSSKNVIPAVDSHIKTTTSNNKPNTNNEDE